MFNKKFLYILLISILFCGFYVFEKYRKSDYAVLNILSPIEFEIDLNHNGITDIGETVCIPNVDSFYLDFSKNTNDLQNFLKISEEDAIKLGYLAENFTENLLANKRVKLKFIGEKTLNCNYADLIINNEKYSKLLVKSGFGLIDKKPTEDYYKQLETARNLKLAIINHKSNKFHTLNCKYGQIAHDLAIIPENQLPKDAKPCKFCHIQQKTKTKQAKSTSIPQYPLRISSGNIKMFLTDLTTQLKPNNECTSLVCQEFLSQINSAQNSIDIALYGWGDIPKLYNALLNAKKRGVKIRIVYDENSYYLETKNLLSLAEKTSTDTPKIIMHNKFIIFDKKNLITGSMNFSQTGFSGFNSNCVFSINSTDLAQIYTEEFEQMLNGKFHQNKQKINHNTIQIGTTKITPLFSPKDNAINNNIIPIINKAEKYIYIPAFVITHDKLAEALVQAKSRNINVKIIIDATNVTTKRSKLKVLRNAGIDVKVENYAGKLHSKSIIIDDKYVIAGSMNFSNSGETKNDENCLIIEDERLAKYYKGFFEYLWSKIPDKYLKQTPKPEGKSSIGSCADGIDNNYDNQIDLADKNCH